MKLKTILPAVLYTALILLTSHHPSPTDGPVPVFGVQVSHQSVTSMHTFIAYVQNGSVRSHVKILDTETFIKYASGYWPSVYNPQRINYFEKYDIGCGMYMDSSVMTKSYPYCFPVDSLWKLKFSDYPFIDRTDYGWAAEKTRPSERQRKFLEDNYNVKDLNKDYFLDTNLWKILRDVRDSSWIENYKYLR